MERRSCPTPRTRRSLKDGSLDIYIQRESPGKDKQANWLPAAEGAFSVTMRIYWPKPEALDGTWKPSPIVRAQP